MNKKATALSLMAVSIMASSCAFKPIPHKGSETTSESPTSALSSVFSDISSSSSSQETSIEPSSSRSSEKSSSSTSSSKSPSSSSQSSSSSSSQSPSKKDLETLSLGSEYSSYLSGSYSRSNNGTFVGPNEITFQYYMTDTRNNVPENDLALICQTFGRDTDLIGVHKSGGFLGNYDPIGGIESISITYKAPSGCSLTVYDETASDASSYTFSLPKHSSYEPYTIDQLEGRYCYFKVFGPLSGDLNLRSISIEHDKDAATSSNRTYSKKSDYRIKETVSASIEEGSTAKAPASISRNGNTYTVTSWKTYTYYSFSYISSHTNLATSYAYTSTVDISNYFMLFKTFPANVYGNCLELGEKSAVSELFGDKARQCSRYTKTNGYPNAVSWDNSSADACYYEVDIALYDTYPSPRGTGRLVAFVGGMRGYDANSTIFYTDDHYQSFQEYLNYGTFGSRFNAQDYNGGSYSFIRSFVSGTTWSPSITLAE